MQTQSTAARGAKTTQSPVKDGLFVVSGYGVRVSVDRGHLSITDGFPDERRVCRLSRATARVKRLVLLGHSGTISLEAMRWLHDIGAALVQIDADGELITVSAALGLDEPRLRRAQAIAPFNGVGLALAKELIRLKIERQWEVVSRLAAQPAALPELASLLETVDRAATVPALRMAEAHAAKAYWAAWSEVSIRFARIDLSRIPAHWGRAGARASGISGSPRKATNPVNAMLNYLYAILEAETRIALLTVGLDPGLGVLHADLTARDSLALDVMEAVRPEADAVVLDLLERRTFAKREFYEMPDGTCRLVAPLPQQLAAAVPRLRRAVAPVAELVARRLAESPPPAAGFAPHAKPIVVRPSRLTVATPLTQSNRRAALDAVRVQPPPKPHARSLANNSACRVCGQLIAGPYTYCDECRAEHAEQSAKQFGAAAVERLRARRAVGEDPTSTPQARAKHGLTNSANRAAEAEWDRLHPDKPNPATFVAEILPSIRSVSARALSRATGLSVGYCSDIKKGLAVPHPRHWEPLRIVGS
jgi:CRISPR-associated endonuclease Cas1